MIKWLLPYLQQYDRQWLSIPIHEMVTSDPRKLVHSMNTYITRWKAKPEAIQKVIDALPKSRDHTAEGQAEGKSPKTVSDNLSQEDEENKGEDVP